MLPEVSRELQARAEKGVVIELLQLLTVFFPLKIFRFAVFLFNKTDFLHLIPQVVSPYLQEDSSQSSAQFIGA